MLYHTINKSASNIYPELQNQFAFHASHQLGTPISVFQEIKK